VNRDRKGCSAASWKNVRLIQDALTGGFYMIQAKTSANCSDRDEEGLGHISGDVDASVKTEKHDAAKDQTRSVEPAETNESLSADKSGQSGWMLLDLDGKLTKEGENSSEQPTDSKPADVTFVEDFQQDLPDSKDVDSQAIPVDTETEATEELVRYYVIGQHSRTGTGQTSPAENEIAMLDYADYLAEQKETDLVSNSEQGTKIEQTQEGIFWHPFPLSEQKDNAWDIDDQNAEDSFQDRPRGTGSPERAGRLPENAAGSLPHHTTPEPVRAVLPAAYHASTIRRFGSITGQSVTWGKICSVVLTLYTAEMSTGYTRPSKSNLHL